MAVWATSYPKICTDGHTYTVLELIGVIYCCPFDWKISLEESKFLPFIEKPSGIGLQTSIPTSIQIIFPTAWELIGKIVLIKPIGNSDTHSVLLNSSFLSLPDICFWSLRLLFMILGC